MTSVNLEKILEYLMIQESLRYEKYFIYIPLPSKILYKHKVKKLIKLAKFLWLFA